MLDHLVPPPDGIPFPGGGEASALKSADGIGLRAAFFRPAEARGKGTVFVLQGRGEFIEKFGEVFTELLSRGFSVATMDWRGQGGSERQLGDPRKGHVEDFDDFLLDLAALVAEADARAMPKPYGILAHSTGGAIALLALSRGESPFRRAVLTSPLVGIKHFSGRLWPRLLARVLSSIGLSGLYAPGGGPASIMEKPFPGNPLTHDETRFAWGGRWLAAEPRLAIGDPTIGWIDAAFEALARFETEHFGRDNRTPVLILAAGDDRIVETAASTALARRMRGASAIVLRGSEHEILMERDAIRAEFWAGFDAFMQLDAGA